MQNQLQTLAQIFSDCIFRIPDYQRGYAWSEKQLKDFWNDLKQVKEKENHYTGVVTLEVVPENIYTKWDNDYWIINSRSYTPYYIVDGQQRLTTSIILIQCILEKIADDELLNFTTKDDIIKRFIFESKDKKITRSYIFGYEHDNPSYEFLITQIFGEKLSNNSFKETIYTQNLLFAKNFFIEKIKDYGTEELENLYKKITQQLLFNTFTITQDVDVCVAFETMNNRGKPLSYLELLKNRLIFLSLKLDDDDDEKKQLRKTINDCWKSIYHNLGRNKDKPLDDDLFLQYHYLIHFGSDLLNTDSEGFIGIRAPKYTHHGDFYTQGLLEKKFTSENIYLDNENKIDLKYIFNYTQSLQESVETWYNIWNPMDSNYSDDEKIYLDKINRIDSFYFRPLTLLFMQKVQNQSIRIEFLKTIEKFSFLINITDRYVIKNYSKFRTIQSLVLNLCTEFKNDKIDANQLITSLNEISSRIKNESLLPILRQTLKNHNFYEWDMIRYFLFEYNLSLQHKSKTERSKINWHEFNENYEKDFITIEHIYPQNTRSAEWAIFKDFNSKEKKILRNSLGNLLPLSQPKNSSLSNKPFKDKVNGKDGSYIGYRFGCYAENEISKLTLWTPEHILERGITLLNFLEKRWGLKLGTEEDKISLLGLDFIPRKKS